jgi:hypothetical protein
MANETSSMTRRDFLMLAGKTDGAEKASGAFIVDQ